MAGMERVTGIWALFDRDTEYFGRPEQAFMVNFRVADLDAMLAQCARREAR